MLNFIICDDNKPVLNSIYCALETYLNNNHIDGQIILATTKTSEILDFLKTINVNKVKQDLYIYCLDINLNSENINGITLGELIKTQYDPLAKIIFITGYAHCLVDAVNHFTEPFGYLIKPFNKESFETQMLKIQKVYTAYLNSVNENCVKDECTIALKSSSRLYVIKLNEVIYIETIPNKDGYIQINTILDEKITIKYPMYKIIAEFNQIKNCFFQCYQSFVINTNYIKNIDTKNNSILLEYPNRKQCTITLSRKKEIQHGLIEIFTNNNL